MASVDASQPAKYRTLKSIFRERGQAAASAELARRLEGYSTYTADFMVGVHQSSSTLLPLMFQLSFGYSAEMSDWLLAPIALMSVIFKTLVGRILNCLGYKTTLLISSMLMAGSVVSMA